MTGSTLAAGVRVMARLDDLARFTSEPGALTRLYLTPEHKAAADRVATWMRDAGMAVHIDATGSVVGRYPGRGDRTLILGSHIDTVRHAGRYDGALGVVVAIEAVASLAARGLRLPFALEVVAFGDEEGVRFPVTLTSSRALAGTFDPATLDRVDDQGVTLGQALLAFGCDPAAIPAIARRRAPVLGYVEVHIEQGPVLEAEGLPVGVVTAISGASRMAVTVRGQAGHAGTVPMALRRDALAAAAEMTLAVEALALETPGLVATVGRMEARPGAVNVIPGEAAFSVDLRSAEDGARIAGVAALERQFASIAARRGVAVAVTPGYQAAAAPCSPAYVAGLADAVRTEGIRAMTLPSGAGHDGLAMATLCPIAMLFVRCAGGISHNPAESITEADAEVAVRVLGRFIENLALAESDAHSKPAADGRAPGFS